MHFNRKYLGVKRTDWVGFLSIFILTEMIRLSRIHREKRKEEGSHLTGSLHTLGSVFELRQQILGEGEKKPNIHLNRSGRHKFIETMRGFMARHSRSAKNRNSPDGDPRRATWSCSTLQVKWISSGTPRFWGGKEGRNKGAENGGSKARRGQ